MFLRRISTQLVSVFPVCRVRGVQWLSYSSSTATETDTDLEKVRFEMGEGKRKKVEEKLRVLFFGSDRFSGEVLRGVVGCGVVEGVRGVVRPGKKVGRGLKEIREAPMKRVAEELGVDVYEKETSTGWTPDYDYNLIIAVSFGKLIPPRLLARAKYGGLNLHPSTLPEFRGSAPIHHTLLQNRSHLGLTLQTLHPTKFDHGTILSRVAPPGIPLGENPTVPGTIEKLCKVAPRLLTESLETGLHVDPQPLTGWFPEASEARKIEKEMARVDWQRWSASGLLTRRRVLGPLWTMLHGLSKGPVRVLLMDVQEADADDICLAVGEKACLWAMEMDGKMVEVPILGVDGEGGTLLRVGGGGVVSVKTVKVEGQKEKKSAYAFGGFLKVVEESVEENV